jgi:hypothetical protein
VTLPTGQLVTVAAQLVMVYILVVYTVDVVDNGDSAFAAGVATGQTVV